MNDTQYTKGEVERITKQEMKWEMQLRKHIKAIQNLGYMVAVSKSR